VRRTSSGDGCDERAATELSLRDRRARARQRLIVHEDGTIGSPPPSGFARVYMSGTNAQLLRREQRPVRPRPHCTSSKISALPVLLQSCAATRGIGGYRGTPTLALHRLDDHRAVRSVDGARRGVFIAERDDLHAGEEAAQTAGGSRDDRSPRANANNRPWNDR